jgi:cytosine/adenosine deaminase-related metal-dependent hydrolase
MAPANGSTGRLLFDAALAGGAAALAMKSAGLQPGAAANLVSLDAAHPSLGGRKGDAILDAWIFAGRDMIDCVWVRGEKLVERGRHRRRTEIRERFRSAIESLLS